MTGKIVASMAHSDPGEAYGHFREQALEGIAAHFPLVGKQRTLELAGLEVGDEDGQLDDLRAQKQAKLAGETWSSPVHANFVLKNTATGEVIENKRIRVAELPRVTRRQSHIVGGKEYQVDAQWQLKPGAYVRRKQTGEVESQFNIAGKPSFGLRFAPEKKTFLMERGKSKSIPLYPVLRAMGVSDASLEKSWGKDVLEANRSARGASGAVAKLYQADKRSAPSSSEEAEQYLRDVMAESRMDPGVTAKTLGKSLSAVTGDALLRATEKTLRVSAGEPEDDRDSLEFKRLRTAGDYVKDKLSGRQSAPKIRMKMLRQLRPDASIRQIVGFDVFDSPVADTFKKNSLARVADQTNPLEMLSAAQQTTIMGEGGIKSAEALVDEAKFVNPSHLGFLDPLVTPESEKTGVVLRLPMGLRKVRGEPKMRLFNVKERAFEEVSPGKFVGANVVLPDQVRWTKDGPVAKSAKVEMSASGNELEERPMKDADYVIPSSSQLFNVTSNLIPFLNNNSGNRASYASNHMEQAVSLRDREAPLVRAGVGLGLGEREGDDESTFEDLVGAESGHRARVSGTVTRVEKDAVFVKDDKGKEHETQLYDNFPLNDPKAMLHSSAKVTVGQRVKEGESLADTNFTKDGTLALGTNLRAAYVPFRALNFEDGVVISESAAKKLSSEHLHKERLRIGDDFVSDPNRFVVHHPDAFKREQYGKLGEDGVVKVGQTVEPGDPLILGMRPYQIRDRMGIGAVRRSLSGQHTDVSRRWEADLPGEVVGVSRNKKSGEVAVHVRTVEPMEEGDKMSGRHGNKGVVSRIIPDKEMPRTKDGRPIDVLLNPTGVGGRMNVGQVLETAAAKVADKTGKPYVVQNFGSKSALESVKRDLQRHGLSDTEEVIDPESGLSLGPALVGPQYMLKLKHQIDKKSAARAGMTLTGAQGNEREAYDQNLLPSSGGKTGGQSIGSLGATVLLAHGAKNILREAQTWKSEGPDPQTDGAKRWPSQHADVWNAIQTGTPLPTPRPTLSFHKFTEMLRATGINVEKHGHNLRVGPTSNEEILARSAGEIPKPTLLVTARKLNKNGEPLEKPGGLFDPKLTGGHGGKRWTHIKLAEPSPNPMFESPIQKLTGLSRADYASVVRGEKGLDAAGKVVALETQGSLSGGRAIDRALSRVDVDKDLKTAERELSKAKVPPNVAHGAATPVIDRLNKQVKYLRALRETGLTARDAYMLDNVPVIPPAYRPASLMPTGDALFSDLNVLYKNVGQVTAELGSGEMQNKLGEAEKRELRAAQYDSVKQLMGVTADAAGSDARAPQGILQQIHGRQPKSGFFQRTLLNRRQDLSMRSVITPEPSLGLDEVGIPKDKARTLYLPFLVRKLVDRGVAPHALAAQKLIKERGSDAVVTRALEAVMKERPLLLKRDPALHKHSVMAFTPRVVEGKSIQIHPLVTGGFNADFDGDTMSAFVPIAAKAVEEARAMVPTKNLFNTATGKVAYVPTLESAYGLYKLSRIGGGKTRAAFSDKKSAVKAAEQGKLAVTDPITLGGEKTSVGRVLIGAALPDAGMLKGDAPLRTKELRALLQDLADKHPGNFDRAANRLKDLGFETAYGAVTTEPQSAGSAEPKKRVFLPTGTLSLSLGDLEPDRKTLSSVLGPAEKRVAKLRSGKGSRAERDAGAIAIWSEATDVIKKTHLVSTRLKKPSSLREMRDSGIKPSDSQYQQIVLAPMLVSDASGRTIPRPVKGNYADGLGVGDYWTQMSGARRGSVQKVQEVRDPGAFSKQLTQSTMNLVVNGEDCGTERGQPLSLGSQEIYDRVLAKSFVSGKTTIPKGTVLSPDVVGEMRKRGKDSSVIVRSAIKCEHGEGLCQKCAGLRPGGGGKPYDIGTNVGVIAAQALGERSVQLTLKAFHSGGVAGGGSKVLGSFDRVKQLTGLPKRIPDSASLAMHSGTIDKVTVDKSGANIFIDGKRHHVGLDRAGSALHRRQPGVISSWQPPRVGQKVARGELLSDPARTHVNPHDLYKATGSMDRVQDYLSGQLSRIFGREGVKREHVETVVKAMGNVTRIVDAGDGPGVIKGEFQPRSQIDAENRLLRAAGKQPIRHAPVLRGVNVLPHVMQDDWMARLGHNKLKATIQEAAATGATSNIHGLHPVPAMAYGAELGLTDKDSVGHSFRQVKGVPNYAY